ncbi:MAG: SelB C-terminal domain-containing protein [Nocardioidaceae bacterium]|nr:SelB C-terminal domain-containing protein [Nocardioidaceae bacterium]
MHVIATAGHVDHGKSTLIAALTGQQPDRLEEERRRGLSIELGYCWTRLPRSGDVAFVDVPGHERFVSTMLAGVGPVPVVLFVVAADDPWMPQAAEHLGVLDALGVRRGVLAVTRSDLADVSAALASARTALSTTSLADIPSVAVSGTTGDGLDALAAALDDVLSSTPAPDPSSDVRIWVDRVFTKPGAGTIVTGTLPAGTVTRGDTLVCGDGRVTVRGLQTLTRDVESVSGVARVSLRLGSAAPPSLRRGSALVTPGAWEPSRVVDVRITGGSDLPTEPMLHVGSAAVPCRVRPLGPADDDALIARLSLDHELPWHVGDRAVLRDPGRRQVWGCRVLDPAAPRLTRRGDAQRRAEVLADAPEEPSLRVELSRRGVVRVDRLRRLGVPVGELGSDWLVDPGFVAAARTRLGELVDEHATAQPLQGGIALPDAARRLGLPDVELVARLVEPPLVQEGGRIRRGSAQVPAEYDAALQRLEDLLSAYPFRAPEAGTLTELGLDRRLLAAAAKAGRLLKLSDVVVLLPGADTDAVELLATLPQPFTTSEARQRLETTRRVVIPLLSYLDKAGLTRRLPDDRRTVT